MRYALIPVCLSAALTACASGVSVSHTYIPQRGVPGHAQYAAAQGPTPVIVRNTQIPPPAIVAALQKNNSRQDLVFTTDPPASLAAGYRVLLSFDDMPAGGLHVCREPLAAAPPATAGAATPVSTSVYGAFCLGPVLLSESVVTAPRLDSPRDPRLGRMMGDLLAAIMPAHELPDGTYRCYPRC
jgi:hypothetical protein